MKTSHELQRAIRVALEDNSVSILDRPKILMLASAYAIGTGLPLSVEGNAKTAAQVHYEEINRSISMLNEIMTFCTRSATEQVENFLAMRYKVFQGTHDAETVSAGGCFLSKFSGANQYLAKDTLATYEANERVITLLAVLIRQLLDL